MIGNEIDKEDQFSEQSVRILLQIEGQEIETAHKSGVSECGQLAPIRRIANSPSRSRFASSVVPPSYCRLVVRHLGCTRKAPPNGFACISLLKTRLDHRDAVRLGSRRYHKVDPRFQSKPTSWHPKTSATFQLLRSSSPSCRPASNDWGSILLSASDT